MYSRTRAKSNMTLEKWKKITDNIRDSFEVEDEGSEHYEEEGGVDVEFIVFTGPLGRMKLELETRPVVLDKKTKYSNRIGSETKVDYVYSADEKSLRFFAYKWDDAQNDWSEISTKSFE